MYEKTDHYDGGLVLDPLLGDECQRTTLKNVTLEERPMPMMHASASRFTVATYSYKPDLDYLAFPFYPRFEPLH